MKRERKTYFTFPMPEVDADRIKDAARADQRSAASLVRKILADWLRAKEAAE